MENFEYVVILIGLISSVFLAGRTYEIAKNIDKTLKEMKENMLK